MLHAEGPVPHVGSGEVTVHAHNRARAIKTIDGRGVAIDWTIVPGKIREHSDVSGRDIAARCIARSIDDGASRNASRSKGVIKCDKGLPVHRFVSQSQPGA